MSAASVSNEKNARPPIGRIMKNIGFVLKKLYRANRTLFFVKVPLLFLNTAASLVSVVFLRAVLNALADGAETRNVFALVTAFAAANFLISFIKRSLSRCGSRQLIKTTYAVNRMLGEAVSRMPLSAAEEPDMRDFISRASASNSFSDIIEQVTGCVGALINIAAYSAVVINVHPIILLSVAAVIAVQLLINRLRLGSEYKWRAVLSPIVRRENYFYDCLGNPRYGKEVRVNGLRPFFADKADEYYTGHFSPVVRRQAIDGSRLHFVTEAAKAAQRLFIYLILAAQVVFHEMRIGDFSMYLASADRLTYNLSDIIGRFSELLTCGAFAEEFRRCMEFSEKKGDRAARAAQPPPEDFSIEFRNVGFKYPGGENYVLKIISFRLENGESLSLVGVNGSGKSTLVKLICRFYEPTEGDILIGGVNIKDIPYEEYSKLLGVVFQDFRLFSFSVRENIAMGMQRGEEYMLRCLEQSGLAERTAKMKDGLDTFIYRDFDESGIELSGGEGQKLAIARLIYRNSPVIILDEPTSALDPVTEYDIFNRFHTVSKGKTAIYISHRLSSSRFTDKVALLRDGTLAEFGTHEELMTLPDGIYREMFRTQARYYV